MRRLSPPQSCLKFNRGPLTEYDDYDDDSDDDDEDDGHGDDVVESKIQ